MPGMMILSDLFDGSLIGRRDKPGLEFGGRNWTFGEVDEASNRMANVLLARGVRRRDRVCVYLPNSADYIALFLACAKTGIIFVPVNILYREREIGQIRSDAEPALFVDGVELERLNREANTASAARPHADLDGSAPAAIVYTSGTTGTSKGAVLSHKNFAVNALNLVEAWRMTEVDRLLLPLPLFHVHGLGNGVHCWLASGCRMRLLERFEHQKAAEEFLSFRPTVFFGVPAMYVRLLEIEGETARRIGSGARLFVSGSAPLPPQVMDEFEQRFGQRILERYGMSETLMNIGNPYDGERRAGTVGFPFPGVEVRLLDESGQDVEDGQPGEVHLRGGNVFSGYWKRPEATEAAFRDGWFKTGDIAVRSADGYYALQGRRSDLIISGGFNIYPREIEELLLEQPGVREAAVVSAPDRVRGEMPVAYFAGETDGAALEAVCREKLASFKVPRAFVRVSALPRTALGKVQKHLLPECEL
jgi:malonyl-CoA/methylmalonyl-CoA synthetase